MTKKIELPNQDEIRTLAEKKTCKYLKILEVDTIKQVEMKEKFKKEYLVRTKDYSKTNYVAKISSKE